MSIDFVSHLATMGEGDLALFAELARRDLEYGANPTPGVLGGEKSMYESSEATKLWNAARTVDAEARKASARELFEAIATMANAAGFKATVQDKDSAPVPVLIVRDPRVFQEAKASVNHYGTIYVSSDLMERSDVAAVEYDPGAGAFVGTAEDTYTVPVPGGPSVRRRPAAAVISAMLIALLRG